MIDLLILSGPDSGRRLSVASMPSRFGKSVGLDASFRGAGVWDEHFEVLLDEAGTPVVRVLGEARICVDSHPIRDVKVRDGLILEVGGVRVQLGIQPSRHGSLVWREVLFWCVFGALLGVQVWAMWWVGR